MPGATLRVTNPVSEAAEAFGTCCSRTRPAAAARTSIAPTIRAYAGLGQELAAPLQADFGPAQVRLINLDLVLEGFPLGVDHGSPQLVQQCPRRLVAEAELALQLDRRQPWGMGAHQVSGPEPHGQWQPATMQHRPRRQRGLPPACLALPQPPLWQVERVRLPAARTAKSVRPSTCPQVLPTSLVVPESHLELFERLREIELAHGATLPMGAFGVNPISRK